MGVVVALLLSAAFGAADQWFGSLSTWPWAADVSLLSAPWLVLAFAAGATQRSPRRAAVLGLGCTIAAIAGYWLLTDSPVEGAQYTLAGARGFLVSDPALFVGTLFTGPLFGWFGQRWRTRRALAGAVATAAALCLEPLARRLPVDLIRFHVAVTPIRFSQIVVAEVAAGLLLAAYFAASARRARSS